MADLSHKSLVDIYEYRYDHHSARLMLKDSLEAAGLEAQASYNQADLKKIEKALIGLNEPDSHIIIERFSNPEEMALTTESPKTAAPAKKAKK